MRNIHIQIKKYSYLLLIFILGMSSCKEDTVGPIFNDLAYFVEGQLSLNVKENDNTLLVPVTHRNHANNGKTKFRVDVAEGTTASLFEVGTFEADFSESDTVWFEVNFSFDQLVDDVQYSISLTIEEGDGYLQPMLFADGNLSCEIGFTKYIPFQTSNFEASYTAVGLSAFSDSDVIFDVTLTYVGPDDEDASKHIYAIDNFYNVDGGVALITLNTIDNTLSCPSQFFKDDYLAVYNDATGSFMNSGSTFAIGELELVDFSQGVYLDVFEEGIVFTKNP